MSAVRYVIFVIDRARGTGTAGRDEMAAIDAFNDRLRDGGHWIFAAGIGGPSTATLIDRRAGHAAGSAGTSLQDGPDAYSGFWIIEAATPEIARELAEAGSAACNRRVELRPFLR